MPLLAIILTSLISSIIARVLLGAGLTFITYTWVTDILDELIVMVQQSINTLSEFTLSFLKLWDADVNISMLLSTVQLIIFIKVARLMVGKSQ